MALINCPECGKEISDKAEACIHCGCPIKLKTESIEKSDTEEINKHNTIQMLKGNKKSLYLGIGIIAVCLLLLFIPKLQNDKEYCEGLKWGTSLKTVEKKYPDLTYNSDGNYYFNLVDSLDGFQSEDMMISMNFYFDNEDKLYKIEADIVSEELDDVILYFVSYFNKIYEQDYEATYDTKYKWIGDKTNISMFTTGVILSITYEEAN